MDEQRAGRPDWQARALAAYQAEQIEQARAQKTYREQQRIKLADVVEALIDEPNSVMLTETEDADGDLVDEALVGGCRFRWGCLLALELVRPCRECGTGVEVASIHNLSDLGEALLQTKPVYCWSCRNKGCGQPTPTLASLFEGVELNLALACAHSLAITRRAKIFQSEGADETRRVNAGMARRSLGALTDEIASAIGSLASAEIRLREEIDAEADSQPAEEQGE